MFKNLNEEYLLNIHKNNQMLVNFFKNNKNHLISKKNSIDEVYYLNNLANHVLFFEGTDDIKELLNNFKTEPTINNFHNGAWETAQTFIDDNLELLKSLKNKKVAVICHSRGAYGAIVANILSNEYFCDVYLYMYGAMNIIKKNKFVHVDSDMIVINFRKFGDPIPLFLKKKFQQYPYDKKIILGNWWSCLWNWIRLKANHTSYWK